MPSNKVSVALIPPKMPDFGSLVESRREAASNNLPTGGFEMDGNAEHRRHVLEELVRAGGPQAGHVDLPGLLAQLIGAQLETARQIANLAESIAQLAAAIIPEVDFDETEAPASEADKYAGL